MTSCPICQRPARKFFDVPHDWRKPKQAPAYTVHWCAPCSYGFVWERPSERAIQSFYEVQDYYTHSSHTSSSFNNQGKRSFVTRAREHLAWRLDFGESLSVSELDEISGRSRGKSLLEIGCGNGKNLDLFAEQDIATCAVELDPKALDAAKKSGHDVYQGSAESLPVEVKSRSFDYVLLSHVLEHCRDPMLALRNAYKLIRPGGVLIVETPNCGALGFQQQQAAWPWTDVPRHLNFFTPKSLVSVIRMPGFEIEATKYTGFSRQYSSEWLQMENEIWGALNNNSDSHTKYQKTLWRAWANLLISPFLPRSKKYDSVRILARRP